MLTSFVALAALGACLFFALLLALFFRTVVPTNMVHIVQRAKDTTSYGKDQASGNTYYDWPAWVPRIGVRTILLPVSVFDVPLDNYAAYDKGRVPFVIDIIAFFRITDSNMAAQRVASFEELKDQLANILKGAIRTILASSEIEEILEGRSKFGEMFTKEVDGQLKQWGVQTVKCIELMDIRDAQGSQVIQNIMAKKKSLIEKESRVEVAANMQAAQQAEIVAQQEVLLKQQEAEQLVGQRTAQKTREVGIAQQQAQQAIKEQERTTKEKEMAVTQVAIVRAAEIEKGAQIVAAQQSKETAVLIAEGALAATQLGAKGIEVEGVAKGEAEKAILLAPVQAQITLAKEIGSNEGYQTYLVSMRKVEAAQAVGMEQAKALEQADIKVISNVGTPPEGLSNVMDLFSAKGGMALGQALEAISNTPTGKAITEKLGINGAAGATHQ
jgi:flotillin